MKLENPTTKHTKFNESAKACQWLGANRIQNVFQLKTITVTPKFPRVMLIQNFRKAAKGRGKYIPDKNELQIRKGRKIYRFRCGESVLRFTPPARPEVALFIATDATVTELRRCFTMLTDSPEQDELFHEYH